MRPIDERSNLLKALEEQNTALTCALEEYRKIESAEWPEFDSETERYKDGGVLVALYYDHKTALQNVTNCAADLKKAIEELQAYFANHPRFPKQCSNCVEAFYAGGSEKKYCPKVNKDVSDVYSDKEHGCNCPHWRLVTHKIFHDFKDKGIKNEQ